MTPKEETLQLALQKSGLRALPKALSANDNKIWLNAIVLVQKMGIENYCMAVNDGNGNPSITQDFGQCIAISKILSIHPIEVLDRKYTPDLRSDKQIVEFLSKNGHNPDTITAMLDKTKHATPEDAKAARDKVKQYINQAAIKIARRQIAEKDRVNAIKEFATNAKSKDNDAEETDN